MLGIWSDLVFAARVLRRNRGFTIIAAASLALAIGANTTIFSVGKQLLFDRLDVPHASSMRLLAATKPYFSYPVYERLRAQNTVLGDLLAFHMTAANATVGDNAERVLLHEVSGNYYEVLGVRAQIGREIRPSDDMPGSPAVAMIRDPATRWSAAGLLLIVALGASWIPARRAAHVRPMDALRRE